MAADWAKRGELLRGAMLASGLGLLKAHAKRFVRTLPNSSPARARRTSVGGTPASALLLPLSWHWPASASCSESRSTNAARPRPVSRYPTLSAPSTGRVPRVR